MLRLGEVGRNLLSAHPLCQSFPVKILTVTVSARLQATSAGKRVDHLRLVDNDLPTSPRQLSAWVSRRNPSRTVLDSVQSPRMTVGPLTQVTKSQLENERAMSHMEATTSQPSRELREAAASAAVLGDGVGASGRYRDTDFFVCESQPGGSKRKFEEEGFSVRGGTASQMDGAVLDLIADDQVKHKA